MGKEHASNDADLNKVQRTSRQTGGDAPAAGSINEREQLAQGEDAFESDAERDEDPSKH